MVNTRSKLRKEQQDGRAQEEPSHTKHDDTILLEEACSATLPGSNINPAESELPPQSRVGEKTVSIKSCNLSSSSARARKAQMVLKAEKLKAKIQLDLIDKQLAADLADLQSEVDEEYSPLINPDINLEKWIESGYHEHDVNLPRQGLQPHDERPLPIVATATAPGNADSAPYVAKITNDNEDTLKSLANALKEVAIAAVHSKSDTKLLSRLSTPRDLPEYSGDPMGSLHFKHAYFESTTLCKFTPEENLWRLRKCLRGPAKEAVTALLISASSPDTIMSTLQLRFGNPDYILCKIVSDIKKLQPMCSEYQKDIVAFAVKIQNFVEAVRAVGREEYLQGMEITTIILSKLPTVLLSKWADYSYPLMTTGHKSRLVLLSDFLQNEAIKMSHTASTLHFTNTQDRNYDGNTRRKQRTNAILLHTENGDQHSQCTFCHTGIHNLTKCKEFKRALRKVRWQHVKNRRICYKCLVTSRHDRATCPSPACDEDGCGQPHHRLLHYPVRTSNGWERHRQVLTPQQPQEEVQLQAPNASGSKDQLVTYVAE